MRGGVAGRGDPDGAGAIRVAVVDRRALLADALASLLARTATFEVVAVTAAEAGVAATLAGARPALVLIGVGDDTSPALGLVEAVASAAPTAQIVLIADRPTPELVGCVLERSLGGLLLTDHPAVDLLASLRHIVHGRAILPAGWQDVLSAPADGPLHALSDRQLQVLRLLAEGCSYEEIGSRLFISINTVKFHTRSIFERLGVRNRMAAARVLAEATHS